MLQSSQHPSGQPAGYHGATPRRQASTGPAALLARPQEGNVPQQGCGRDLAARALRASSRLPCSCDGRRSDYVGAPPERKSASDMTLPVTRRARDKYAPRGTKGAHPGAHRLPQQAPHRCAGCSKNRWAG
eukprot:365429-Chlamydomonas_euryale.AAC.15